MLYLINSKNYYKIGYTLNEENMINRMASYRTHNPDVKVLGTRHGDKESERYFNRLLRNVCQQIGRTEWYFTEDATSLEKIFNLFTEDAKMISEIGQYISFEKIEFPQEEIYTSFTIYRDKIKYGLHITESKIYLYNFTTNTNYELNISNFKLFYKNYSDGPWGDYYSGIILKNCIIVKRKIRMSVLEEVLYIHSINSDAYKLINKELISISDVWHVVGNDFISSNEENSEENSEESNEENSKENSVKKPNQDKDWITEKLQDKSYSYGELEELFREDVILKGIIFNGFFIKDYFPEFEKFRRTRNGKKETYYKFKL